MRDDAQGGFLGIFSSYVCVVNFIAGVTMKYTICAKRLSARIYSAELYLK